MPGEAAALLAAAIWAFTVIVLGDQSRRIDTIPVNAFRSVAAALFVVLLVPFGHGIDELRVMSLATAVAMVGSGILAMGAGDSLLFVSIPLIGASRAVPISNGVYPLLTLLLAYLWLDEELTAMVLAGTALIVAGVWLLVQEESVAEELAGRPVKRRASARDWRNGLFLLGLACVAWALATTWLSAGSGNLGAISAGSVRLSANALVMAVMALAIGGQRNLRRAAPRDLGLTAMAGILGVGIGSLLYIFAVQEAGAGKTAVLTSTMPLFSLPMAVLYLHERVTLKVVTGTVLCIAGIALVA